MSLGFNAVSRSCLLASTSSGTPTSLGSSTHSDSSAETSSKRRLSAESITQTSARVP